MSESVSKKALIEKWMKKLEENYQEKIDQRIYSKEKTVRDRQKIVVFWLIAMPGIGVFLFVLGNSSEWSKIIDAATVTIVSVIFLAIPLGFILYPPVKGIEKFFAQSGAAIVIAYQLVTKMLYVSGPIMIITLLFFLLPGEQANSIRDAIQQNYSYMIQVFS